MGFEPVRIDIEVVSLPVNGAEAFLELSALVCIEKLSAVLIHAVFKIALIAVKEIIRPVH